MMRHHGELLDPMNREHTMELGKIGTSYSVRTGCLTFVGFALFLDAVDNTDQPELAFQAADSSRFEDHTEERLQLATSRLYGRWNGFLEVDVHRCFRRLGGAEGEEVIQEVVVFIHRSVPEFLTDYLL